MLGQKRQVLTRWLFVGGDGRSFAVCEQEIEGIGTDRQEERTNR